MNSDGFLERPTKEVIRVIYDTPLHLWGYSMSVRVQTYVWQLNLPPTQKLVAIALADHCHDDGSEARPSQALLIKKTGLSEQTVRRCITGLLQSGVIVLERPSAQHRANVYKFILPQDFATIRGTSMEPLTNFRGAKRSVRGAIEIAPEVPQWHPNHKEPLVETISETLPDLDEVKRRNREIFNMRKIK